MPLPSPLEACRADLLTSNEELARKYPPAIAERVARIREIYNLWLTDPSMKDHQLRDTIMSVYGLSQSTAYSDISIVHQLVPLLSQKSRDFHRARYNEMILETYNMAKEKEDFRTMEKAASSYGKFNDVGKEEEEDMSIKIPPQPFAATTDPSVLGIKPIPNVYEHISKLTKELSRDFADIEDVEYEEADLQEDIIFPKKAPDVKQMPDETD